MPVVCSIVIAVGTNIVFLTKADVEGKVIVSSDTKYLVDFSVGITKYEIHGNPEDYSRILVEKTECVKE